MDDRLPGPWIALACAVGSLLLGVWWITTGPQSWVGMGWLALALVWGYVTVRRFRERRRSQPG